MRTIGVISDTHGLLRAEALEALEGSALILHAGDVGDAAILDALGEIAPVHAVHGNTDHGALRRALPASVLVDLGAEDGRVRGGGNDPAPHGPLAYVPHGDRELDLDPAGAGFAVVVSGHTHRPAVDERDGVLHVNPGSAGPKRFRVPVTVARLAVDGARVLGAEIVELEGGR